MLNFNYLATTLTWWLSEIADLKMVSYANDNKSLARQADRLSIILDI
jgi:hypothetical protein